MSIADGTSVIPPGWYPDPADSARLRRWDGQQWTQEVILAPEQEAAQPVAQPTPQPAQPSAPAAPPMAAQPPPHQPVPASPAPTSPPPGEQSQPAPPAEPTPPSAAPPVADVPMQPTVPRPSPPVNQHPNPPSGPVSLPEWANLPGLTLPPDLSGILGTGTNSVLNAPTFEETERRELPTLPVFEPPFIPQRPDVQDAGRQTPAAPAPQPAPPAEAQQAASVTPAPQATPYAPPPAGAKYDVPPPPGMAHVPSAGPVLPPSAFVAPQPTNTGWPTLPPVGAPPQASQPIAPASIPPAGVAQLIIPQSPSRQAVADLPPAANLLTISSILIGALPLLQFAVIYVVFGLLGVILAPGMQWGILAAPAAFSLLFANADRKRLTTLGADSPSIIFAFIPPLYLIVRCVTTGRSSLIPLIAWVVLQAGAAAGIFFLLPTVLSAGMHAMGIN